MPLPKVFWQEIGVGQFALHDQEGVIERIQTITNPDDSDYEVNAKVQAFGYLYWINDTDEVTPLKVKFSVEDVKP